MNNLSLQGLEDNWLSELYIYILLLRIAKQFLFVFVIMIATKRLDQFKSKNRQKNLVNEQNHLNRFKITATTLNI